MQERRRRASGAPREQSSSTSCSASADSCESQPPTWDNRSPQDTARARYTSRAIRHGLREDKYRTARAVHATSAIDATRAQHLTRTGDTPLRDLHLTPRAHELPASNAHSCITRRTPPGSIRRRCSTLPSFVYRQEVFELSIVASSIAHAHEEADRRLTISHKHTTWAKVGARNAQQRAIRQPSSQAGNEKATRSSPYQ